VRALASAADAHDAPRSGPPPVAEDRLRAYLAPGRILVTTEDVEVSTILGSCVSVCLWDAGAGVGGMNHYLLPSGTPASTRFGDAAMDLLVGRVLERGARRSHLAAKLFGGACVLEAFRAGRDSLGARNVEVAREHLRGAGIPVLGEDVGGDLGRKVLFHVRTGAAWVRAVGMK
jgi:chemotaxis protein CheD